MSLNFRTFPGTSRRARTGLGDAVSSAIGAVLDATPMPAKVREKIKACGGCARRRDFLNRLAERKLDPQKFTPPPIVKP